MYLFGPFFNPKKFHSNQVSRAQVMSSSSGCHVSTQIEHRATSRNYWKNSSHDLILKFYGHDPLCVSFLKKLVSLNLKLYRASYVPYITLWSRWRVKSNSLLLKIITILFRVQWTYNLYSWIHLEVQFHLKLVSFKFEFYRLRNTIHCTDGHQGSPNSFLYFVSFLVF